VHQAVIRETKSPPKQNRLGWGTRLCLRRRKFVITTASDDGLPVYPNRAHQLVLTGLDQLRVADITYMLLRFQKAAVRGNYETGNQAFSMRLRFLTIWGSHLTGRLIP
jgi:hypothetical protein